MPDRAEIERNLAQHRRHHERRLQAEAILIAALWAIILINGALALVELFQ